MLSFLLPFLHLFAGENESLLLWWDSLLLLDTLLDSVHLVRGLNVDLNLFPGQGLQIKTKGELWWISREIFPFRTYFNFDQHAGGVLDSIEMG